MNYDDRSLLDIAQKAVTDHAAEQGVRPGNNTLRNDEDPKRSAKPSLLSGIFSRSKDKAARNDKATQHDNMQSEPSDNRPLKSPDHHQSQHSEQPQYYDPDQPILDLGAIIASVWHKRFLIILTTIIGAVLGILIALSTPHSYYAEAQLLLDPREVEVVDSDFNRREPSGQVVLAMIDSQMQVLRSTAILEKVVGELNLTRDPEFNGSQTSMIGKLTGAFKSVITPTTNEDLQRSATDYLRDSLAVLRDPNTFVVRVGVNTQGAQKSALIANKVVEIYLSEVGKLQSDSFSETSEALYNRLDELQANLDAAERAINDYQAENDIIDVGGGQINQKDMLALSDKLASVRAEQVTLKVLAENLSKMNLSGVTSGAFPKANLTEALSELRKQYVEAKAASDSLSAALGPRHPKFIAAQSTVQAVETEIRQELARIVETAQTDVIRAKKSEDELVAELAVAKSRAVTNSGEFVELNELQRRRDAIKQIYESFLRRARETTERGNLETNNFQIISGAEEPFTPSSRSRKTTVIMFTILGAIAGFGYAVVTGAIASLSQSINARKTASKPYSHNNAIGNSMAATNPRGNRENNEDMKLHHNYGPYAPLNAQPQSVEHPSHVPHTNVAHGAYQPYHVPLQSQQPMQQPMPMVANMYPAAQPAMPPATYPMGHPASHMQNQQYAAPAPFAHGHSAPALSPQQQAELLYLQQQQQTQQQAQPSAPQSAATPHMAYPNSQNSQNLTPAHMSHAHHMQAAQTMQTGPSMAQPTQSPQPEIQPTAQSGQQANPNAQSALQANQQRQNENARHAEFSRMRGDIEQLRNRLEAWVIHNDRRRS